jgi:hypothetical protein
MSGRLVSAVFESALPAWLKPYAAAYASFAADNGTRVYPTIGTIALMVGRCERSTQYAIADLRRRHILEPITPAGRHQAPRYRFHAAGLPQVTDGVQLQLLAFSRSPQGFPQAAKNRPNKTGPRSAFSTLSTGRGAMGCTPGVQWVAPDPSIDPSVRTRTTRARAKRTGTEDR